MNTLYILFTSFVAATTTSLAISLLYMKCCDILVHYFKYNYGNENYWIFSPINIVIHSFILFILSWIISFGLYIIFLERNL
jgi:hypothetical protein